MTAPPGKADTLDLSIDPELVHDRAQPFRTRVGDQRAQILRVVAAAWFHSIEDRSGVFAQWTHGRLHSLSLTPT